jgi:[ribosomal protein S5]-alanine N-acetyltransferase
MDPMNFIPFPGLTTERLTLRQLQLTDENEIFALRSDKRVNEFLDRPKAESIEDARQFINKINKGIISNEVFYWGIILKNDLKLIGTICYWNISKEHFTAEMGFELQPGFQGKGIMQEAMVKIIDYGFAVMKLNSIDAETDPNNSRSIKLLERNGFVCTRKSTNTVIYSLVKKSSSFNRTPGQDQ